MTPSETLDRLIENAILEQKEHRMGSAKLAFMDDARIAQVVAFLRSYKELREAAKGVIENTPCSDLDCCKTAIECENARLKIKECLSSSDKLLTELGK